MAQARPGEAACDAIGSGLDNAEFRTVPDSVADHFLVAVLKDVQWQERTGKQDGCERKDRNFFKLLGTFGHDEGIVARPEPCACARASGPTSSDMCF